MTSLSRSRRVGVILLAAAPLISCGAPSRPPVTLAVLAPSGSPYRPEAPPIPVSAPPPPTPATSTPPAPPTTLRVRTTTTRASRSERRPLVTVTSSVVTVTSGGAGPCGGWEWLLGRYDWPLQRACRTLMCESGGNPNARNRSGATGLMQVMGGSVDPEANVAQAYAMWKARGWQPWVCR